MVWRPDAPQGNEAGKILWELVPYTRGFGLDIGCGPHKAFPHFVGIDNRRDTAIFGIAMNPDLTVPDATRLPMFADGSCDFIFSSHLLEHLPNPAEALREWWRLLKVGGHLCLYLPHKLFYPNIGQPGANPDHKHDFLPQDIVQMIQGITPDFDLRRNEDRNGGLEYSFFQVYQKLQPGSGTRLSYTNPRPPKKAAVVRYGAWGDSLQASSVFPGLKEQGFHITLYTTPRAYEVVSADPHIDEVILQDVDQVPNTALGHFWANERQKYDRWVNLSESVEATLLALHDRIASSWPKELRHEVCNKNYVEFQHKIAGVPYDRPHVKFYPTLEEKNWAYDEKLTIGADPLVMWVMAGSSVHKVWPHIDPVFARILLDYPKAKIVTVGDERCRMLDEPWRNEPRIVRKCGVYSIRQTLALAQVCDIVVGPETGVLSGVSMEPMPKIVFLSHSTVENLTRDWINTYSLFSTRTACYPCHKLHYSWDTCMRNNDSGKYWEGTAQCQVDIPPDAFLMAFQKALQNVIKLPSHNVNKRLANAS